ncbi:MAG: phosphoenolpyruvate synthase [Prevotellaceae bacterium]|jgi:CheY-like chemotaxis protein|nr:phosphoenolpyruvate synthase [Prevotellaceae bacterium]
MDISDTAKSNIRKLYFKDTSFADLMKHRIYNVLLVSSKYDAFILEEDGRIDEQIFNEYIALNLRYAPRFTLVETEAEARAELEKNKYELIITMSDSEGSDIIDIAKRIKAKHGDIPIIVLTPFLREVSLRLHTEDVSDIDYVFSWLGNSDLLLAIIKLLEDRMNVKEDVESVGVQILLFIEDSTRFASSVLPYLYKFVFNQSRSFMTEALNDHQQMLRMRGRPKILMARTYEEALSIFEQYSKNILGVISDVSFPRGGKTDKTAGIDLCKHIRQYNPFISYILESSENQNRVCAEELGIPYIDKNNEKTLPNQLKKDLLENFGFGDFIFRNSVSGKEIARASDLKELQKLVLELPDEILRWHFMRNDVSKWLYSRAMFPLASFVEGLTVNDFNSLNDVRQALFDAIVQYRKIKNRGIVAVFRRERFDRYSNFARIGSGSMGGKGRGLAFLDSLMKNYPELEDFEEQKTQIGIPKTVILCTDIFDEFMETNNLYPVALSDIPDELIFQHFQKAKMPKSLLGDFVSFFNAISTPIAVRSSSLLEDSYYQPFAGIYSTYMIPYEKSSKTHTLYMLDCCIKAVYASVFYRESKLYMASTSNVIDSEKMAIVLQEVVGSNHNNRFYPSFSGVARSINFYPIEPERPEDGICNVALGLGKYVVDGGVSLRFSPCYPKNILQTSELDIALRETQTKFFAINLADEKKFRISPNDVESLMELNVKDAEGDGSLRLLASTFDYNDRMLRDGIFEGGRKVITFSNILKHDAFPLAPILQKLLKIGQNDMGYPVEIEFAVNLEEKGMNTFNLLQIRPIVENKEVMHEDISSVDKSGALIFSNHALGNGIVDNVYDIVYVKPENFDASKNRDMAVEIEKINAQMSASGLNYILIGPGRWGSSDPWLGIPVKWTHISAARLIIEAGLANYRIDPSQGTHFFHNLTSFRVGYFTVNAYNNDGYCDMDYLSTFPAIYESRHIRHVRLPSPAVIKIDGKLGIGIVLKI